MGHPRKIKKLLTYLLTLLNIFSIKNENFIGKVFIFLTFLLKTLIVGTH